MSDEIPIQVDAKGADGVDRIVTSIDRLHAALTSLGNSGSDLKRLESAMQLMQASMTTGFAEMSALAQSSTTRLAAERAKGLEKMEKQQLAWEARQHANANKFHDKQLEIEIAAENARAAATVRGFQAELAARADAYAKQTAMAQAQQVELRVIREKQNQAAGAEWDKFLAADAAGQAKQRAMEQAQQVELRAIREKLNQAAGAEWEKFLAANAAALARQRAMEQAQQVELRIIRERQNQEEGAKWERFLALDAAAKAKQREMEQNQQAQLHAIRAAAQEKQRVLDTAFLTAGLAQQIAMAEKAKVYSSLGGNANITYGGAAAGADIARLQAEYARLNPAVEQSRRSILTHNEAMREGHALARGLAGSLGGLWLTYGSAVPLLAGAAIATALKNVVSVGMEVEKQLTFVFALSEEAKGVDLSAFLAITDSSLRSVVESANAMRALAQNGLEAGQSLAVLPAILDLATVGEMSAAQAALAATGATSAFGLSMFEASRVADIFSKAAATSNTSVLAMTESMKQASTVASLFKVSIEDTAAMIGLLAKINITGGAAGTSITNMLTGLYEPTEKAKRALKELGVVTHTTTGELKPIQEVLGETRAAMASLNDSARVDVLGSIFTVRGVKSAQLFLENLDGLKIKSQEAATAAGYMRGVIEKLEDSSSGAFTRLGVTIQNTFTRAFVPAAAYVQELGVRLGDMAKDGQGPLTNLSLNLTKLTLALVENLDVVSLLGAAYLAWGALSGVRTLVLGYAAAISASTVAQAAATAASVAYTTANAAGAATTALWTAAIEAQTAATTAATAATAAGTAIIMPALAALAIAVAAGTALWLLFRDSTDDAQDSNVKLNNSLHAITESLDREIESLTKVNALWDEKNGKYRDTSAVSPAALEAARDEVTLLEAQIRAQGRNPAAVRTQDRLITTIDPTTGVPIVTKQVDQLADALARADKTLAGLTTEGKRYEVEVLPAQALKKQHDSVQQLNEDLDRFIKLGTDVNSKGELDQKNPEVLAKYREALKIKAQLFDPSLQKNSVEEEMKRVNALSVDLKQLRSEAQSLLSGRAAKPDVKGENDALKAAIARNGEAKKLLDLQQKTELMSLAQQNAEGQISDIAYLVKKADLAKSAIKASEDEARANLQLVEGGKNKLAATQKYESQVRLNQEQSRQIDIQLEIDKTRVFKQQADEQLRYQQKTLQDQGQNTAAFLMGYEAQYGTMIKKLQSDLASADEATRASAQKSLDYLEALGKSGVMDNVSKDLQASFNSTMSTLTTGIADLANRSKEGGLAVMFDNALAAERLWAAGVDEAMAKQKAMQELANMPGADPKDQKAASDALKKINDEADKVRNIWVSVGDSIGKSLTAAFGAGGTAAGGLLTAFIQYGNARKKIEEDFKDAEESPETRVKMAKALASAQINAYGNMAGAAKGFFKEGTKGYEALAKAEKIFRVAELAMSAQSMVQKLFETTTVMGAKLAANTAEAAGAVTTTGVVLAAEGTKSTAYGVTALAAALAAPFPANIPAFAMVAAMLAAIGVAVSGSGGSGASVSEQRQASIGTGSVLGDSKAKSESIAKSLALVEGHTYRDMQISAGMLSSLRSIESNIGRLGALVARTDGANQAANKVTTGTTPLGGAIGSAAFTGAGAYGGALLGGSVAGALTMGTMGGSLTALGAVAGPLGMLAGALIGAVLGKALSGLFGTTVSVLDQGLTAKATSLGKVESGDFTAQSFAEVQKKKKALGITYSSSTGVQKTDLSSEISNQFALIIGGMGDTIRAAAGILGESGKAFNDRLDTFVVDLGLISLKGLTGTEAQEKLEAAFSKVGDDMAKFAMGSLTQFQAAGEGAYETLVRIANDYATVDAVLQSFGKSFGAVGMASVAARERLIELSGGLSEFTSQGAYFLENFFTDAEKAASLRTSVNAILTPLNQGTAVTTIEQFKKLAMSQDLTTESGAKTYASMMAVAQAFIELTRYGDEFGVVAKTADEILSERKDLQQQLNEITMSNLQLLDLQRSALDASNRVLFDQIQAAKAVVSAKDALAKAYETEAAAAKSALEKSKSWVTTLNGLNASLALGSQSTLTPEQKYAEARAQFEKTLAAANAGDTTAQSGLSAAEQAFLTASQVVNAADARYAADYARVVEANKEALKWAVAQVDVQQASLDALNAQVSGLITINESVLTVAQAIANLQAAMRVSSGLGVEFTNAPVAAASVAAASSPVPAIFDATRYSAGSNVGSDALVAEIRALNARLDAQTAEIKGLRADQDKQTGATIQATVESNANAAKTVVAGVDKSAQASAWAQKVGYSQ